MSRTISATALQAVLAQETDEIVLVTLKIDHSSLASPLLFVNDKQDLIRSDGTYVAFPFEVKFPEDTQDNTPKVNIVIDNVDQQVITALRQISSRPTITINIVLKSSPDTPEIGPLSMELKSVDYDALQISGNIGYEEDFLNEPFPSLEFTPKTAAGMFA